MSHFLHPTQRNNNNNKKPLFLKYTFGSRYAYNLLSHTSHPPVPLRRFLVFCPCTTTSCTSGDSCGTWNISVSFLLSICFHGEILKCLKARIIARALPPFWRSVAKSRRALGVDDQPVLDQDTLWVPTGPIIRQMGTPDFCTTEGWKFDQQINLIFLTYPHLSFTTQALKNIFFLVNDTMA